MGITTIEWAHYTHNPWEGCCKVSAGCKVCYAEFRNIRWHKGIHWGKYASRRKTSVNNWKTPLKWQRKAAAAGERKRVFCASLADVFELHADPAMNAKLNEWRQELWNLIRLTPNLDWMLLTKRPENILDMIPAYWHKTINIPGNHPAQEAVWPENVWIGTSVEDQEQADIRIPLLLQVPANIRFLSMEPLVGPVDLNKWLFRTEVHGQPNIIVPTGIIHSVIVGGESGRDARPMHPDWPRSLRDQCAAAGVPFFFKQWGEHAPGKEYDFSELLETEGATGVEMVRVGKKKSGRQLDGVEHNAMPA